MNKLIQCSVIKMSKELFNVTRKLVDVGTSLGVRLPKTDLDINDLKKGDKIRIRVEKAE